MEQRYMQMQNVETRSNEENGDLFIEGIFSVYNSNYNVWDGVTESIAPGAFRNSIHGDVRALYNHNSDIILGRTTAGTLELEDRAEGLWGRIKLNRKDTDAANVYERIARGDITGCSFGFDIKDEERTVSDDGSVHYTIKEVDPLFEISPVVFPAYEATHVEARHLNEENIKKRMHDELVVRMKTKLKGE